MAPDVIIVSGGTAAAEMFDHVTEYQLTLELSLTKLLHLRCWLACAVYQNTSSHKVQTQITINLVNRSWLPSGELALVPFSVQSLKGLFYIKIALFAFTFRRISEVTFTLVLNCELLKASKNI